MGVRTSTRFRRERAAVPSARAFVKLTLRSAGAADDTVERLELAAAEACNNVVFHASGPTFTVHLAIDDDRAVVTVADEGAGFVPMQHPVMPPPLAIGKRGIPLMEALVERVDVSSGSGGTTVVLDQPLGGAAGREARFVAEV
jgi:anti-sigma regulatory factor (Ser/Thr protein kinase)